MYLCNHVILFAFFTLNVNSFTLLVNHFMTGNLFLCNFTFWRINMKLADVHQNKPILARKLKRIRTHIANMTQSEFAESLGITRIYVSQLENPDSPKYPSSDLIRRISDIYHIDYEYLINTQSLSPTLDRKMEIVLKKLAEDELFISETENRSPSLQIFATNYYRLIEDRLIDGICPEDMNQKSYETYSYAFYHLFETLCQTMQTMRKELKESDNVSSDLFEIYLQTIQNQGSLFIREEKDRK